MASKRQTQRNRAITVRNIKEDLTRLCREDLRQLQAAIEEALQIAPPAPPEDRLTAPGEWLEERHVVSRKPGQPGRFYVYLRWIDDAGKERGSVIYRGTLAQYIADRL